MHGRGPAHPLLAAQGSPLPDRASVLDPPSMRQWHLAELNVARAVAPVDGPELAEFVAGLASINALAEAAPGAADDMQPEPYCSGWQ
jgi:hypothetical protein